MGTKTGGGYCPRCGKHVVTQKNTPNNILHLLLSFITAGVWLVIWVIILLSNIGGYRCVECGYRV